MPGRPRAGRLRWTGPRAAEPDGSGDRFGLLLLVLIATYILSAFVTGAWVSAVQTVLFVVVAALATRTGRIGRRNARMALIIMVSGSAAAVVLALTHSADAGAGAASLWAALVLLFAAVVIVRRVLTHTVITLQSIFGAVAAYMILGLMFAALYSAINRFGGGGFFASNASANVKTFQYFSFTTLTTLGYGDYTAAASGGQAVAVMEALFGQVFLATLVARLVASFRPRTRPGPEQGGAATGRARRPRAGGRREASRLRRAAGRPQPGDARRISSRGRARPARR
ncbi:MAG: potassium channel family protein [Gemmatimonadota bacterium]